MSRGWEMSFHQKMVTFWVYVNLLEGISPCITIDHYESLLTTIGRWYHDVSITITGN